MRLRSGKAIEDTAEESSDDENKTTSSSTVQENQDQFSVANARRSNESETDACSGNGLNGSSNSALGTASGSDFAIAHAVAAAGMGAAAAHANGAKGDSAVGRIFQSSRDLRPHDKNVLFVLKLGGSFLVIMYFIIPAIVKLNPWIMSEIAFLHRIRVPFFANLDKPTDFGLNGTLNFKIPSTDDLNLGAWHILPASLQGQKVASSREFAKLLQNGEPIVIYFHGNAGTRATNHRVALYKVFAKAGFHTIAVDYRGYADSEGSPSEQGLVEDALAAFNWVKSKSGNVPVYFWGHSLGTGVATQAASKACQRGTLPTGVILEAPFTSVIDAAISHPLSTPFRYMPYFTWVFVESLKYNNIYFSNDKHIRHVTVPVLILHAKDDNIVPFHLGQKLYEVARSTKTDGPTHFVGFEADLQYSHDNIYKAKDLMQIVQDFMAGRLRS